ncbi:hypothetical protein LCL96_07420 [Rossellomorea aquimaris]|uniref:hypothetical protein n=1 Tax=Rossellomorea TaxID=2837508 RepID=UPI001CD23EEC|nr:hypothetical protein [Rossellomorea aquimaris]MCA1058757.1 hypothetical protein [Rossellomorea aquimaris]
MEENKKMRRRRVFISILLSSLLATCITLFVEKGDMITTKSNIIEHFQQSEPMKSYNDLQVVSEKEAGGQYLLLYTYKNKYNEKEIGLVHYRKMKLLPFFELDHFDDTLQATVGTGFLNNGQFIVYGNREELGADYFTYRRNIEFKRVNLREPTFFIQIETFENRFFVPRLNFYSNDGKIVASTRAK